MVVKLDNVCLLHHVTADCGVMSIAYYFHPKQQLDQWVCKCDTDSINEHISWSHHKSLVNNFIVGDELPQKCK